MADPVAIIGGGQAGLQLCMALRKEKYTGPITLFCAEPELPYHRPPLSKSFVTGSVGEEKLPMRPESFYEKNQLTVKLACEVEKVDVERSTVFATGREHAYSALVFATGARPRILPFSQPDGVFVLRDLADARQIKARLTNCRSLAVIGAGFIGLEIAAASNAADVKTTVIETAVRVMGRAVAPDISNWFEQTHRTAGIDIRLGQTVAGFDSDEQGNVAAVRLADATTIDADLVVVGIGVIANDELAQDAGLACDNGIVVDDHCRTANDNIYACGDCASHPNPFANDRLLRLESIQNATDQARAIAASIAGRPKRYHSVPWFWSDQGAHKLQMTGLAFDADQYVIRGDRDAAKFSVFHYKKDRLLAVDSVNHVTDHMLARKLIAAGVSPVPSQAADHEADLAALLVLRQH